MKIQIVNPWCADKAEGETVQQYGVDFTVVETSTAKSVLVADLPDEEAQAMIDAGRATEYTADAEAAEAAAAAQDEADRLAAEAAAAAAKGKK